MSVATLATPFDPPRKYVPANLARIAGLVLLLLAGLPVAVWLDLRNLSEHALRSQADELGAAINAVRSYYGQNVVGRVLHSTTPTQVVHNYHDVPGAIPIPATLSLELGSVITSQGGNIGYRFFSDYPFHQPGAACLRRLRETAPWPRFGRTRRPGSMTSPARSSTARSAWSPRC